MTHPNRRGFLRQSAAGVSLFTIAGTRTSASVLGANNRLRVAVVGANSRGKGHISGWLDQPNAEIAYIVDPDSRVIDRSLDSIKRRLQGRFTTKGLADIRKALEDPNLDAISVATPNHWHSLITIWAAQAGKHVYVEKPMSHDVEEGRICVEAQKKYGVVIQHGTQRRSSASDRAAADGAARVEHAIACPREERQAHDRAHVASAGAAAATATTAQPTATPGDEDLALRSRSPDRRVNQW